MTLRIGDTAPDFEQDSTAGRINFHRWMGDSWCVLFSHPSDFTPVCTTELGEASRLRSDFEKRNVKMLGLSVDSVDSHNKWSSDIEETQGVSLNFPLLVPMILTQHLILPLQPALKFERQIYLVPVIQHLSPLTSFP